MFLGLLAAFALTGSAGCPKAAPGEPPPVSANPDWLVKPDSDQIFWAYPPKAAAEKLQGKAIIECQISVQGAAEGCKVLAEEPKGYGFGEAAISLAPKMLFKPRLECGVVTRGEVRIPMAFEFPPTDEDLSAVPLDPNDKKLMMAARLVRAMRYVEEFQSWMDDSAWELIKSEDESGGISADERRVIVDASRQTWLEARTKFANAMARSFAANMSDAELAKAVDFYEGPVGSKLTSVSPKLQSDMQAVFETVEPTLILQFHQHYCEKLPAKCVLPDAS